MSQFSSARVLSQVERNSAPAAVISAADFAAISERFDYQRVRVFMLSVASVGLVAGVVVAIGQPITAG